MDETAKLVVIILLASFAIERVVAAIGYCFDTARVYRSNGRDAAETRAKHERELALVVVAGMIAAGVIWLADLRILRVLKLSDAPALVDAGLTWLVLFAGADRIRQFLGGSSLSTGSSEVPAFRIHVDHDAEVRELSRRG